MKGNIKKLAVFVFIGVLVGLLVSGANAKPSTPSPTIDPIVSTDWLYYHSAEVVILDVRSAFDYGMGHIPGSINEPIFTGFDPCTGPSSNWIIGRSDCVWMELPRKEDLFRTIGNLGITKYSLVVIVTASNPGEPPYYGLTNATRVADTLIYAGVKNVAILDGGYPKWVAEGKPTNTQIPIVYPITYSSKVNEEMFVSIEYVRKNPGKAIIVDDRDADVYFGAAIDTFVFVGEGLGHIPRARSLPAPWMWESKTENNITYYTYKDKKILEEMASGVIGHRGKEIIVYCSVGGYASTGWFVLTQVLGYENVKFYDGGSQEWVIKGYDMVPYEWN